MNNLQGDKIEANILIVDDVIANLSVLSRIIEKAGYTVRPVSSVKQAMQAVQKKTPQLILLDITMPDIDGFEWCAIMKKNPVTRDIPIIFISGMSSKEDRIRGLSLGAVDFISKPFDAEEVTLRINTHLKLYNMQKTLEGYNRKLQKLVSDQAEKIATERKELILLMARMASYKKSVDIEQIENISENSRLLAVCFLLTSEEKTEVANQFADDIELAAMMYDIGMVTIEDSLLSKEGIRSVEEEKKYQSHTKRGVDLLLELAGKKPEYTFLSMAIQIAQSHHEWFDGSGYPDGLKEDEIPLAARIVSISHNFARRMQQVGIKDIQTDFNKQKQNVIEEMLKESGTRFDPTLIVLWKQIQNCLKY